MNTVSPPASPYADPIVFIAGGTGGHIAPCLAIAERLRDQLAATPPCWFICSTRDIDRRILEPAVAADVIRGFTPIPARPFSMRPLALAGFTAHWGRAVAASRRVIRQIQGESPARLVAVSTGGFVGPPAMHAARVQGCRRVLINLDAVPGRAGRWMARSADLRLDASPDAPLAARHGWTPVGPIVRAAAQPLQPVADARRSLGLEPDRPTLLVTGGSQGARSVNAFITAHLAAHADLWRRGRWQALHLCGPQDVSPLQAAYTAADVHAVVTPFLDAMGLAWAAADVHVGRAGAATVAEIWCARTPSLLFPYPYHKDQHQARNAAPLVAEGIAHLAHDHIDARANLEAHADALARLMQTAAATPSPDLRAAREPAGVTEVLRKIGGPGNLGEMTKVHVRKN